MSHSLADWAATIFSYAWVERRCAAARFGCRLPLMLSTGGAATAAETRSTSGAVHNSNLLSMETSSGETCTLKRAVRSVVGAPRQCKFRVLWQCRPLFPTRAQGRIDAARSGGPSNRGREMAISALAIWFCERRRLWPTQSSGNARQSRRRGNFEPSSFRIRSQERMPSRVPDGHQRGWIVPIGGAENKENDRRILERFVRVSGGEDADIVIIPTASRAHETGPRYEQVFTSLGAPRVTVMDFDTRRDCQERGRLERIEQASGIFFTGGNQLRLTTLLGGTPVAKLIRLRNAHGVTVGGTSAGASILSEHMIASGDEGSSMIAGSVRLAPGLGLTNRFIIDQHFSQRDRLGRLLTALAYNPFAVGIGLDEDTAAFIGADEIIEVEGSGGVTIVDPSDMNFSSIDTVEEGQPVCMLGLKLHLLVAGATFNLNSHLAAAGALSGSKE